MEEKELQKLLDGVAAKHKEAIKTEVEAATAGLMKADELGAKLEAIGVSSKEIKSLTEAVEKQGEELRKIFEAGQPAAKSIDQIIDEKAADLKKVASGDLRAVKISVPRVQKTTVTAASFTDSTIGQRLSDVGQLSHLRPTLASLFRRATIGANMGGTIRYFDQSSVTRNAAGVAENTAYAESAIAWTEYSASAVKIADSIPVSKEQLNDVEFVKGELDRLMNINLALKEDQQLYAGTGVAPQLKGINVYATDLSATLQAAPYLNMYTEANVYDLIAVLRVVLTSSKQSKYMPNVVLMNPADILRFKLKKASDGHYVLPPFIAQNGMLVDGVQVVESNQVTANTLTIGDFRYGTIYEAQGLEIEIGLINDQFVEDAMTIKASKRELLLVRNADAEAFGKLTSITSSLTYLDSGVVDA